MGLLSPLIEPGAKLHDYRGVEVAVFFTGVLLAVKIPRDLLIFLVFVRLRLSFLENLRDVVHALELVDCVLDVVFD